MVNAPTGLEFLEGRREGRREGGREGGKEGGSYHHSSSVFITSALMKTEAFSLNITKVF